jgi:hypothetical protein
MSGMQERVYELDAKEAEKLRKLLLYDPYSDNSLDEAALAKIKTDRLANVIFARQNCTLKDGLSLGLDRDKFYLCIKASEEFLVGADEKLKKEITGIKRAPKEIEDKVIAAVNEEESRSNQGVGLIFG